MALSQAGLHPHVANQGILVAQHAENNVKLVSYYLKYRKKTSRSVTLADITLSYVHKLREHHNWELAHKDVELPELTSNWPRNMENMEEYFCGCLSVTGIPLAYAVREKPEVFPEADDPVDNYGSMQDELITHALILTVANPNAFMATYLSDCQCVWDKIMVITCELDCWMYVHPTQHTRDGHLAYQNLNEHYLGVNNMDIMSTLAEAKLASMTYDGEKDHWNFEKYMKIHIVQHAIIAGLVEHGYSSIDERSKVCHLMNDIKIRDLDPVKMRIWSDAMLCNAFDACINLFKDYIAQNPSLSKVPSPQATDCQSWYQEER